MNSHRLADVRLHHQRTNSNHRFSRNCFTLDKSRAFLCRTVPKPAVQFVGFICQSSVRYLRRSSHQAAETFDRVKREKQKANAVLHFQWIGEQIQLACVCLKADHFDAQCVQHTVSAFFVCIVSYRIHVSQFPLIIYIRIGIGIESDHANVLRNVELCDAQIQFDISAN